jgi:hypothetical protein
MTGEDLDDLLLVPNASIRTMARDLPDNSRTPSRGHAHTQPVCQCNRPFKNNLNRYIHSESLMLEVYP